MLPRPDTTTDQIHRTIRLWGSTARTLIVVVAVVWVAFLCGWAVVATEY
jgi:hypothetical protein